MVLAPEHPLVDRLTTADRRERRGQPISAQAGRQTEIERARGR